MVEQGVKYDCATLYNNELVMAKQYICCAIKIRFACKDTPFF